MWHLTGPNRFLGKIVDDLHNGISTVAQIPPYYPGDVLDAIKAELDRNGRSRSEIISSECVSTENESRLTASLNEFQGLNPKDPSDVVAFATSVRDTVFFCQVNDVVQWSVWSKWIQNFRNHVQQLPEYDRPAFCIVIPDRFKTIPFDVGLRPYHWRGVIREADVGHFVDDLLNHPGESRFFRRLRLSLVIELARSDLALAAYLGEISLQALLKPIQALKNFRLASGWMNSQVPYWTNEAREEWQDRDEEHSCYLEMTNQVEAIQRRIWKSQITSMFPYLENRRLEIVSKVKPLLPRTFQSLIGESKDAESLELGELCFVLKSTRVPDAILRELRGLKAIRDELAHLRPATFDMISKLNSS